MAAFWGKDDLRLPVPVKKVNKQNGNMQQRNFDRELLEKEKDTEKRKESRQTINDTETDGMKEKGKETLETFKREDIKPDMKKGTDDNTHGKLIDILV